MARDRLNPTGGVRLRFEWERRLRDDPEARGARMAVLLVMATHFNRKTERIAVGRAKLAEQAGVTERTVTRVLEWAVGRYLDRTYVGRSVGRNSDSRPSEYALCLPLSARHFSGTPDGFSETSGESQRDINERDDALSAGHSHAAAERGQSTCSSEKNLSERDSAAGLRDRPRRWPAWCRERDCDPRSSRVLDDDGRDLGACPRCHPQLVSKRRSA